MAVKSDLQSTSEDMRGISRATFGGGCFWCTEAVFKELQGVENVVSGYAGGQTDAPTYRDVCSGSTGHAEVVQIEYRPGEVSYEDLLQVFFSTHDPTTLNRQGNDVGTQYRSVIFFHDEEQRRVAEAVIAQLDAADAYVQPIVTEVSPFTRFYPAEDYHRDYFALHGREPYCQLVIQPKLDKFRALFHSRLKSETN